MTVLNETISQTLVFVSTVGGVTQPMVTALEGTVLELTSGSQPIQLKLGNLNVTSLKITCIYTGQAELPTIDLTDSSGTVLQTEAMTGPADIPQDLFFGLHRGVYYLNFHNTGAGVASFTAEIIFDDGFTCQVGFA